CAYNRFVGEPCCSSKRLLHNILRNQWSYDKIIVSDCSAIRDFVVDWGHNTHPSEAHAAGDAVMSGTDLECGSIYKNLNQALADGLVSMDSIDASLRRLFVARFRLGEMSPDEITPWDDLTLDYVDSATGRGLALEMARKSMVLLKNNGILPLPSSGKKILVMGPNAADSVMQWGNYSGTPSHTVTILDGIRAVVPDVAYARGCDHVVSADTRSCFNLFDGGLKATYRNTTDTISPVVATALYTTPLSLDGGGATVFAPGVNLYNFSGLYRGTLVPDADGLYVVEFEASKGEQVLRVDGSEVARREAGGRQEHNASYMIEGKKGQPIDIELYFTNGDDVASLKFDVKTPVNETFDPADSDVIVFVGGISPALEGEEMKVSVPGFRGGDRETIELPAVQRRLLARLKEYGKPIVMVNCSGSAVGLAPEDSICDAILQAWYPGQEGGTAVADVLFGRYNPSGRLPVTFYRDDSQLPDFQDYSMAGRTYRYMTEAPLYPFGHGLSYTTFEYSDPKIITSEGIDEDFITLSMKITNTGDRAGDDVPQIYVRRNDDQTGLVKTLAGFMRVSVPAGDTQIVTIDLSPDAFKTWDNRSQSFKKQPGEFTITVGSSSTDVATSIPFTIK
ncbi:MAG: glycoside hydrolase family 3 C-terminal domain-containing protein, partial [Muribaculaceae bacterium]|nr:glycoside hydrolase family 3 C-terminal domain-containing protein [Muribaculaceae bacterium]